MTDREAGRNAAPRHGTRPGDGVDLSPHRIEAAMRRGEQMRAEAARELLRAAGAGLARLSRRAAAGLAGALRQGAKALARTGRAPAR